MRRFGRSPKGLCHFGGLPVEVSQFGGVREGSTNSVVSQGDPQLTTSRQASFWAKVDRAGGPDTCWPWTGRIASNGYGEPTYQVGKTRKAFGAHRLAYESAKGPIPPGLLVRHSCHNRPCCNPAHLSVGTHADNMRDMVEARRSAHVVGEANNLARLTASAVREIRAARRAGAQLKELAERFGVSDTAIWNATSGITWNHVTEAVQP